MLFTVVMKSNKDFSQCYRRSKYVSDKNVTVYYLQNRTPYNKLGITTSKKIGNAVKRNRARRIIRDAYRKCEKDFPIGLNLVFVARKDIITAKSTDIEKFINNRVLIEIEKSLSNNKLKK